MERVGLKKLGRFGDSSKLEQPPFQKVAFHVAGMCAKRSA